MKKRLVLTLLLFATLFTSLSAQESSKDLRKEKRSAELEVAYQKMSEILKSKSFVFVPNRIQSSLNQNLVGVGVSSSYGVWVTPYQFKSFLPVFGSDPYTGQATLLRTMDFFNENYQYNVEERDNNTFVVTVEVTDREYATNYTFVFNISINNSYTTLNVSTVFTSSITFEGTIVAFGN